MTCPQCASRVPAKALWNSKGLSGVVCPQCNARLCPKAVCTVVLFAACIGLGEAALLLLQSGGQSFAVSVIGFFAVFAAVYFLAAPSLIKLRVMDGPVRPLAGRRV
jgi:DNA-directed RNA polymerase subunit RPC12/RpoP